MSSQEKDKPKLSEREELIKIHCENQDCEGCPSEEACREADEQAICCEDFDDYNTDYDDTGGYP